MLSRRRSRVRGLCSSNRLFFVFAVAFMLLAPAIGTMVSAQGLPIRAQPTAEPTERFDPPLQTEPSPTPTREPPREPALTTELTAVPLEPTAELPVAIVEPSTLTINKGVCDDSNFDPYTATGIGAFEEACFSPDGEFEFTVSDGLGFAETALTSLGSVEFTVPVGAITIAETIPEGFGDPAVFCWSDLLPTPSENPFIGNGPIWEVGEGEQVECLWLNVSAQAGHDFFLNKYECPEGFDTESDWFTFSTTCITPMDDVGFNVTDGQGPIFQETVAGNAEWPGLDFGDGDDLTIAETIPDGYGEPVAFCTILLAAAADPEDFDTVRMEVVDGVVSVSPQLGEQDHYHCAFFNILGDDGAPGDLIDPASQEGGEEVEHKITLTKRTCPAGADPDAGLATLLGHCVEAPGVEFTLEFGGGATSTIATDGSGVVSWDGLPYGPYEILETNFVDYELQSAHCQLEDLAAIGAWSYAFTDGVYDGSFDLGLDPEDGPIHLVCDWFNFEPGEGAVTLNLVKHRCPLGVPEDSDLDNYLVICAELFDGVSFTLDHAGGSFPGVTANGGEIEWTEVPTGEIEIQEALPPGYKDPLAFCGIFDGEQELQYGQASAAGGVVPLTVPAEATNVTCWLINIQDPETVNSLTVNKWLCPPGFDEDVDIPHVECTEAMDGVTFTLDGLEATTGDFLPGAAVFQDIPDGDDYELTEILPEGIASAFVGSCAFNGLPAPVLIALTEPPTVLLGFGGGDHWDCSWFNILEEDEENSITIRKWQCPEGTNPEATQEWFEEHCLAHHDGVLFTITSDIGVVGLLTLGGTAGMGPFIISYVDIQEQIPDGFGAPVVFCTTGDGLWQAYPAPSGHWEYAFADDGEQQTLICHVYNIPVEENDILIRKWICPEGASYEEIQGWYQANCIQQHDGVEFKVASDIGIAVTEMVGGVVQFNGLPAGIVGIQETIPAGYGKPVVFCQTDGVWQQLDAPTGHWGYGFADDGASETLVCHVYNIPGERPDLTILKWTCLEGYDLNAAGADPQVDCTEATNGIGFELRYAGHVAPEESQTTGDLIPGGVFFDDLQPDSYEVTELVPEGIDHVFVLECTGHIMGVLQPYPLQVGPVLEIDLDAGEHLTCHYYNVPEAEGGSIVVTKYTCQTEIFVSEVECQVFEDGATFDLLQWNVGEGIWEAIDTQVTDGVGQIVWLELEAGDYGLEEHDGAWCHLTTNPVFGPGDFFTLFEDEETLVHVYNCDGVPGDPGDTPTKYPNTGAPNGRDDYRQSP